MGPSHVHNDQKVLFRRSSSSRSITTEKISFFFFLILNSGRSRQARVAKCLLTTHVDDIDAWLPTIPYVAIKFKGAHIDALIIKNFPPLENGIHHHLNL